MTALTLAVAESRLILRNRTVLVTAAILPIAMAFFVSRSNIESLSDPGTLASMQLAMLLVFGVFMTSTMTLAARRQQRYLKRLRSSPVSTTSIVAGLTGPLVLVAAVQTLVVLAYTAWESGVAPEHPELLVLAFANGAVTSVALGFLTASFTKSPEAAQITVLPGTLVFMAGIALGLFPFEGVKSVLVAAVPGAGMAELTRHAWDGSPDGYAAALEPLLLSTIVAIAAVVIAARLFRWQPRP
ncbi:ABC transporter permease [Glycomyces luteolus]|uniref:ABC transporter permease n=1 Tax=Glycomyces luteolus TaxID=2670330 RepID=A0A9X3P741_9ACTN|nr:ABC transporter permease [Glycomyces luteolus]MDA1359482.1 ABC transporter permease [Glycomyces luteolus]